MDKSIVSVIKIANYNRTCDWYKCKKLIEKGTEYHDATLGRNTKLSVHLECYDDFNDNISSQTSHNQF